MTAEERAYYEELRRKQEETGLVDAAVKLWKPENMPQNMSVVISEAGIVGETISVGVKAFYEHKGETVQMGDFELLSADAKADEIFAAVRRIIAKLNESDKEEAYSAALELRKIADENSGRVVIVKG